jgi:hypothetical protein
MKKIISVLLVISLTLSLILNVDTKKNHAHAVAPALACMGQIAAEFGVSLLVAGGINWYCERDSQAIARKLGDQELWVRDPNFEMRDKTITMAKYYDGKDPFPSGVKAFFVVPSMRAKAIQSFIASLTIGTGMSFLVDSSTRSLFPEAQPYITDLYEPIWCDSTTKDGITTWSPKEYYKTIQNYFLYDGEFLIRFVTNDITKHFGSAMASRNNGHPPNNVHDGFYGISWYRMFSDTNYYRTLPPEHDWTLNNRIVFAGKFKIDHHRNNPTDPYPRAESYIFNFSTGEYDEYPSNYTRSQYDTTLESTGIPEFKNLTLRVSKDTGSSIAIQRLTVDGLTGTDEFDEYIVNDYIPAAEALNTRPFASNPFINPPNDNTEVIIPVPNDMNDWSLVNPDDVIKQVSTIDFGNVTLNATDITSDTCTLNWSINNNTATVTKQSIFVNGLNYGDVPIGTNSKTITNLEPKTRYDIELVLEGENDSHTGSETYKIAIITGTLDGTIPGNQVEDIKFDTNNIKDILSNKLGYNTLVNALTKLQNINNGTYDCPKIKINLFDVFNASTSKFAPNISNPFINKEYDYIDFCILEEYEIFNMNLVEFLKTCLGTFFIFRTFMYCWRKIIPNDSLN